MLECQKVKEQHEDHLAQKMGVVGVGVGQKWVEGTPTDTPAILVFVEKKRTKKGMAKFGADIVPDEIDGIPTDVIEVGKIVKQNFRQRVRPVKPGFSCGHQDITAGTIGGFFLDKEDQPVFISNNHVLANENKAKAGDPIFQPGPQDTNGQPKFNGWNDPIAALPYIGTLKRFIPLQGSNNIQDSAIAAVHPKVVSNGLIDALYPILNRSLVGFGPASVGMQVQKCGRTTGYTNSRIIALNASFTVGYDFGGAKFNDCIVMSNMSKDGDSGSLILDMNMRAVGLLFAGSNKVTIANPISHVQQEYGLKLWNPTGAVGIDTLDFGDKTWRVVTADGKLVWTNKLVTITSSAHHFCYLENDLTDFNSVSVIVNTGNDEGATWGPGLTVVWPTGTMKVNLRHGDRFGGYFNGTYNITLGTVKPNTDYTLRIRRSTVNTFVGEIQDGNRWYTVIELPTSIFPQPSVSVRVGKTDLYGQPVNHSEPGKTGTCTFRDFQQS